MAGRASDAGRVSGREPRRPVVQCALECGDEHVESGPGTQVVRRGEVEPAVQNGKRRLARAAAEVQPVRVHGRIPGGLLTGALAIGAVAAGLLGGLTTVHAMHWVGGAVLATAFLPVFLSPGTLEIVNSNSMTCSARRLDGRDSVVLIPLGVFARAKASPADSFSTWPTEAGSGSGKSFGPPARLGDSPRAGPCVRPVRRRRQAAVSCPEAVRRRHRTRRIPRHRC